MSAPGTGPTSAADGPRLTTFEREGLAFDVHDHRPTREQVGTAVLLHGFPQDATAYDDVVPHLVRGGLRVLVPDQRGYSPGARPSGRRPYVLRELVEDVVALLDAAGVEEAHVVGHDWGGAVAWAVASRRSARVASLTALSTPHPAALAEALRYTDQARRSTYILAFQVPRVPEARLLAGDGAGLRRALRSSGLDEDRTAHYVERLREPGALTAALAWYRALPLGQGFGAGIVHVPTVLVHGRADPFFSAWGAAATHRYVRGPYRSIGLDADHWLPESHPLVVADAVLSHLT
ncbi:alpha/beta fold hydrolase [Actinotalea sp. BY-33]|uniref:Alpha/beta fold hydrolase n=1 Tax=Actinotalea soli TaxID=2819234 RepID=A0A939LSN6_9CELL|nr:alpha/beta fold hydrolase [Actinotalea soli]MBO1753153.1 alpha/beta fold hydrolase [Actinotalea soli]